MTEIVVFYDDFNYFSALFWCFLGVIFIILAKYLEKKDVRSRERGKKTSKSGDVCMYLNSIHT